MKASQEALPMSIDRELKAPTLKKQVSFSVSLNSVHHVFVLSAL